MKNDKKFDELLRKKLEEHAVEPPEHVWQNIRSGMEATKRSGFAVYWRWAAAAAVVILALGAGLFFITQNPETPVIVEQLPETEKPAITEQPVTPDVDRTPEKQSPEIHVVDALEAESHLVTDEPAQSKIVRQNAQTPDKQEDTENLLFERVQKKTLAFIDSKTALISGEKQAGFIRKPYAVNTEAQSGLSEEDKRIIEANIARLEAKSKTKNETGEKWRVGMHVASAYASSSKSYKEDYAQNMTNATDKSGTNTAGGFSVQYGNSSRWKFESGFYYSSTSNGSQNRYSLKSSNMNLNIATNESMSNSNSDRYNTVLNIENGETTINGSAGVIKISKIPSNSSVIAQPEYLSMASEVMMAQGEIIQEFNYVEVPVIARYLLFASRLDVELIGGLSANMLVGNNVYMNSSSGKERVGAIADLSVVNFSATGGLGLSFDLTKNLALSVEPRASYNLNSLSKNSEINFRPWRMGVYAGVTYAF